jgi:hypothetical protein
LEDERRKRQDLETRLAKLETAAPAPTAPAKSIEDFYAADPQGTLTYINGEIAKLTENDPYGNAAEIERLRDLKFDLRETGARNQAAKRNEYDGKVAELIPDFPKAKAALEKFAQESLGYTLADLSRLTDPRIVGENAALKTMKLIKTQFDLVSGTAPVRRESQAPAPFSMTLGGGVSPSEPDTKKMTDDEWFKYEKEQKLKKLKT